MGSLTSPEIVRLFAGLAILLGAAMTLGELARRVRQPAIVGETLAGILLGPSVLGIISPSVFRTLFPQEGPGALALETFVTIAVVLLLFVAGLEMDLSAVSRYGRKAMVISLLGIVVPFSIGGAAAYVWPDALGMGTGADPLTFALFFATALAISALPVIAKTLMDLNLLRTDLGVLVMTGAMVNDLLGWLVFSVILSMMGTATHGHGPWFTVGLLLLVLVVVFAVIRPFVNRALPWVQGRLVWPGGVLSFVLVLVFAFSALTEMIGIHATLGAFLVGIAVGDSPHLRERTREILHYFVMHVFAPIFFAAIGLYADIAGHFNLRLVAFVLVLATLGKVAGGYAGARLGRLHGREALAIGFGLNARGAMGIILAILALQYRVIEQETFVALVIMSLVTSVLSGPIMDLLMARRRGVRITDLLSPQTFVPELAATTLRDAIRELQRIAAERTSRPIAEIEEAIRRHEALGGATIGNGIAIPHARLANLRSPVLVVGRSIAGLPCSTGDRTPIHLVFLLLTPREDSLVQLELLAEIAARFEDEEMRRAAMRANSFSEFLAELSVTAATMPRGHERA